MVGQFFPRLYFISNQKEDVVCEMGCWRLDRWVWKLNWRRETFEWELLEQLQILLNSVQILSNELDSWVWQNCNSGKYSTNWAYKLLLEDDGMVIPSDIFSLAWRLRRIPNKVAFLLWRAFKDRLPTKDNLVRRNVIDHNADLLCCFCHLHGETAQHIFLTCPMIWQLWLQCHSWMLPSMSTILSASLESHFNQFSGLGRSKSATEFGQVIWSALIFCIWKSRNNNIFRKSQIVHSSLIEDVTFHAWSWLHNKQHGFKYTFAMWSSNILLLLGHGY